MYQNNATTVLKTFDPIVTDSHIHFEEEEYITQKLDTCKCRCHSICLLSYCVVFCYCYTICFPSSRITLMNIMSYEIDRCFYVYQIYMEGLEMNIISSVSL